MPSDNNNQLILTDPQEISLILTRRELKKARQGMTAEVVEKLNTESPKASNQGLARPDGFGNDIKTSNPKTSEENMQKNQALRQDKQYWDKGRPTGWDSHCEPDKIHKGRLTPGHPMYWFEENVFRNISNKRHQEEHSKIKDLLKMPVQTNSRDRVYHALCHLDVLWTEGNLPVSYKAAYEKYKQQQGIGDDNIHPSHKKPGVVYPAPKNKRPWDAEEYVDYDKDEVFVGDRGKGLAVG